MNPSSQSDDAELALKIEQIQALKCGKERTPGASVVTKPRKCLAYDHQDPCLPLNSHIKLWEQWQVPAFPGLEKGRWDRRSLGSTCLAQSARPRSQWETLFQSTRQMAPEECHPRLTPDFPVYTQTSVHLHWHICAPAHRCIRTHRETLEAI